MMTPLEITNALLRELNALATAPADDPRRAELRARLVAHVAEVER